MAAILGDSLDFQSFEALNLRVQMLASAPSVLEAKVYYDSTLKKLGIYNGTVWNYLEVSSTANTANTAVLRDGSGNFAANQITAAKVTGLNDPTGATDAATKQYVDLLVQGIRGKFSYRVATTANITLSGTQTIDGIALAVDDTVLVKNQSTATQNGVYLVKSGAWVRQAEWANGVTAGGYYVFIQEGATNADTGWLCTNDKGSDVINTASLAFVQFSGAGQIVAGNGLTKTGNQLDVVAADLSIVVSADAIRVGVDNSTIEVGGSGLQVKNEGITADKLNIGAIGIGLERVSGTIRVKDYTPVSGATLARFRVFTQNIGGGTASVFTHNYNNVNISVEISDATTGEIIILSPSAKTVNSITYTSSMTSRSCIVKITG
jgi:hypothetical protein